MLCYVMLFASLSIGPSTKGDTTLCCKLWHIRLTFSLSLSQSNFVYCLDTVLHWVRNKLGQNTTQTQSFLVTPNPIALTSGTSDKRFT